MNKKYILDFKNLKSIDDQNFSKIEKTNQIKK
jgi:hypothetical protein